MMSRVSATLFFPKEVIYHPENSVLVGIAILQQAARLARLTVADEDKDRLAGELFLRRSFNDGGAGLAAEEQRRGVALRVAADQQHALSLLRHHVGEVGEREALAGTTLAVNGNDLGFFGGSLRVHRLGFMRGLLAKTIDELNGLAIHRGRIHVHALALQSKTIFKQCASPKAVARAP